MNRVLADVTYAFRQLRKSPGFAATAILTLALGIAANSTILSWIASTLFNPIPQAAHTDRMFTIQMGVRTEHPTPPFSYPDFVDLREGAKSLAGLIGYHDDYMSITGNGEPRRIYGALVTADYFEVLGVRPLLGRSLIDTRANERAGAPEAVLGYGLWQGQFGGDPNIVGKTVEINLHPYTIVGVAPQGFQGCKSGLRADIWLPLGMDKQVWGSGRIDRRGQSWLNPLAVLKPGVDRRTAEQELNVVIQGIAKRHPTEHRGDVLLTTDPLWRSPFGANVYLAGTLPILLALAAVLLLLACANVANLLLVRSVARRREFAIRMSMGAGRWALVRQQMVENLLIAIAGGGLALLSTVWTVKISSTLMPITTLPLADQGYVDARAAWVMVVVSILTAIVSGIAPALRLSQLAPGMVLKDEALNASSGMSKSRLSSGLVVAQMALSLLMLACAGLFVRSLENAQKENPGFDPKNVYLATFDLDPLGYDGHRGMEFERQVVARLRQLPGVDSATLADFSPLNFTIHSDGVLPEGYVPHAHETIEVDRGIVWPGYLTTLRTPLLAGRDFNDGDLGDKPQVALVNQAFADRYWPGQGAVGKHIQTFGQTMTVVGVVANAKYRRMVYERSPLVLMPLTQQYENNVIVHVRTKGNSPAMRQEIEDAIHGLNANLPLYNETTLRESMSMGSLFERIAVTFAGSFGLLALFLSAVGLYGVVAYAAGQRTHEIGIRMALGAGKGDIFRDVLGHGLRLTLAGLGCGVAVSLVLTRFVRSLLYGVDSSDWVTFSAVAGVLCAVAILACYLPARRAASVDPMQALRTE